MKLKRLLRILLFTSLAFLGALMATVTLIHVPAVQNRCIRLLLDHASRKISREIRVETAYISLSGYIEIRGCSIANKPGFGDKPLGECEYIYCAFNPMSVIRGQIEISHLVIHKPVLRLAYDINRESNIRFKKKTSQRKRRKGDDAIIRKVFEKIRLKRLDLLDGFYEMDYQPSNLTMRVESINVKSWPGDSSRIQRCELTAHTSQLLVNKRLNEVIDVDATADIWGDGVHSSHIQARSASDGLDIDIRGSLENFTYPQLNFKGSGRLDLEELVRSLDIKTPMSGPVGIQCAGYGPADDLLIDGQIEGTRLIVHKLPIDWIQTSFRFNQKKFKLIPIKAHLLNGTLSGEGDIDINKSTKGMHFKSKLENADLKLAAEAYQSPFLFPASGTADIEVSSVGFEPSALSIVGDIKGIESIMEEEPLGLSAKYRYQHPLFVVQSAEIANTETRIDLAESLFSSSEMSIDASLQSATLGKILDRIKRYYRKPLNLPNLDGNFSADLRIQGPFKQYTVKFSAASDRLIDTTGADFSATAEGQFRPDQVSIDQMSIEGMGKINGKLAMKLGPGKPRNPFIMADLHYQNLDLERLLKTLGIPYDLKGRASGDLVMPIDSRSSPLSEVNLSSCSAYGVSLGNGQASFHMKSSEISDIHIQLAEGNTQTHLFADFVFGNAPEWRIDSENFQASLLHHWIPYDISGKGTIHARSVAETGHKTAIIESLFNDVIVEGQRAGTIEIISGLSMTENSFLEWNAHLGDEMTARGSIGLREPYPIHSTIKLLRMRVPVLMAFSRTDQPRKIVRGFLDGELDFSMLARDVTSMQLNALIQDGDFSLSDYAVRMMEPCTISIIGSQITINQAHLAGIDTDFTINGSIDYSGRLSLNLNGNANLSGLTAFTNQLEQLRGRAVFDLMLQGPVSDPDIFGEMDIQEMYFRNPIFNTWFEDFHSEIVFRGRIASIKYFDGMGGNTYTHVYGDIGLKQYLPAIMDIKMEADGFEMEFPEGFRSEVNTRVALSGGFSSPFIEGDVLVKKSRNTRRIDVKTLIIQESRAKLDLRKRRVEGTIAEKWPFDPKLSISIFAPDNVIIDNNVAKLEVKVDLQAEGLASAPRLFGQIEALGGKIIFQGREFDLDRTFITFSNPLTIDPVIDLLASTEIEGYNVSIEMTGPVYGDFFIRPYSSPPLSEVDLWSLIAIGKTQQQLTESSSDYVASGVAYVTGSLQDELEKRFKSWMGFDEFSIDPILSSTDEAPTARFTVKKRFGPDLTVTYSRGIAKPSDLVILEYQISDNLYLIGQKKEDNSLGADLRFRWEFR